MGLAAYPNNMKAFRRLIGPLRRVGYRGHIILGVHSKIPEREVQYLKEMEVTFYSVDMVECDKSISTGKVKGNIRGKCATGLTKLKLEWGRYEMARQWLAACTACTGWSLVMDTRDIFFQSEPFLNIGDPAVGFKTFAGDFADLLFIEEIAPHSSPDPDPKRSFVAGNFRNRAHTVPCYGESSYQTYSKRPVLCSGTVIGTRKGMTRFLSVLVSEFIKNNEKANTRCRSPTTTDQWTMNWLYYNGKFGFPRTTATLPWGTGPVQTVGKACITGKRKPGATDIVKLHNGSGLIMNIHDQQIAPVVHQFDRCTPWIKDYFISHPKLFDHVGGRKKRLKRKNRTYPSEIILKK
jgi:hypothetical protein